MTLTSNEQFKQKLEGEILFLFPYGGKEAIYIKQIEVLNYPF